MSKSERSIRLLYTAVILVGLSVNATQAQPAEEELVLDGRGVPIGCDLIEGDIIICSPPDARGTHVWSTWPDGIVPYEFDANVNATNRQRTLDAAAEWEAVAAVDFQPWDSAIHGWNKVRIRDSSGDEEPSNSSMVGMVGGTQVVNIVSWTAHMTIAHEFGHALGYWHEQSRPDRNDYVRIEWDRIVDGKEHNFDRHGGAGFYGPYDFDSIMHYGQCAFSCCGADPDVACGATGCGSDRDNCRTITVLPPNAHLQDDLGNRSNLSFWDAQVMSFVYPQPDWYFVGDATFQQGAGTYLNPWRYLFNAYSTYVPEGSTIWVLEPGDWLINDDYLDRPMTIRAGQGTVTLVP